MDRGIWATWYDLPEQAKDEYLAWLHGVHLPSMLARPGYLWAAHVENILTPAREAGINRRLTHIDDPSVPAGVAYLLLFGALSPHTFLAAGPDKLMPELDAEGRAMLGRRVQARSTVFVEVDRVEGPDAGKRRPGITPGPVVQFGSFNTKTENELDMSAWYARSRLPLVQPLPGSVGARKLVSIAGWAKHAILYEFSSLAAAEKNLVDGQDWTRRVVDNLVHAPHSPSLGVRIWPQF